MSLVTLKEILEDTDSRKYAIGMFNASGIDTLRAIIDAAEELKSPVIVALAEIHLPFAPLEMMGPLMSSIAGRAKVPVAVHLDHGCEFAIIMKAIREGFTSVMFDGSLLDYKENLRLTKEVVKTASAIGCSVEAEIGHVGGGEGGGDDSHPELYTEPEKAAEFAEESGIDALAVAIGTVHGEFKKTPCLDFERLSEIHRKVKQPLVLHGGSGLSDNDFRECVKRGIGKINIFTDMSYAAVEATRQLLSEKKKLHYLELSEVARNAVRKTVMEKMELFGSSGKA